jgi:tRNA (guanine-N7-)-methyltransferase
MAQRELVIEAPELRLDPERIVERVDWKEIFGDEGPVEIEIGIGKGRFLLRAAEARPEIHHLGVEWANKYLRFAESRASKRGLSNVRFVRVDAGELMPVIPDSSVQAYYVFYPDPWPKKRQMKRRFLQRPTADQLARSLAPAGLLHVATDHTGYWETIEPLFDSHPAFERLESFGGDEFPAPLDEPLTNFEAKYVVENRSRHRGSWRRRRDQASRS